MVLILSWANSFRNAPHSSPYAAETCYFSFNSSMLLSHYVEAYTNVISTRISAQDSENVIYISSFVTLH